MSIKFSYAQKQITPLGSKFLEETQNYEELVFKTSENNFSTIPPTITFVCKLVCNRLFFKIWLNLP